MSWRSSSWRAQLIKVEFLFAALVFFSVIAIVNVSLFSAYFQVDDFEWLHLAQWRSVLASFHGPWGHGIAYRPISRVSFYLDAMVFGWRAGAWHTENLVIHAINCGCLYVFARRLQLQRTTCFLGALLFAISPLGSENVDWISGRTGLLCQLFLLLGMLSWIAGLKNRGWWVATAMFYVIGMMTYEPAVVLPILLLCLIPIMDEQPRTRSSQLMSVAALSAVGAAFWLFRTDMLGMLLTDVDPLYTSIWTAVLLNAGAATRTVSAAWGIAGPIGLGFAAFLCLRGRRTRPIALVLIVMAAVLYLPFLMVVGVAPRFLFMAQAPLCILIALATEIEQGATRRLLMAVTLALALLFARTTYRRASSMTAASNVGRSILDQMARYNRESETNLVVDGVPDAAYGSPVLSFYFETAAQARLGSSRRVLARSPLVLMDPELLHAALTQPTRYLLYDPASGALEEVSRGKWVSLHSAQIRAAGEDPS